MRVLLGCAALIVTIASTSSASASDRNFRGQQNQSDTSQTDNQRQRRNNQIQNQNQNQIQNQTQTPVRQQPNLGTTIPQIRQPRQNPIQNQYQNQNNNIRTRPWQNQPNTSPLNQQPGFQNPGERNNPQFQNGNNRFPRREPPVQNSTPGQWQRQPNQTEKPFQFNRLNSRDRQTGQQTNPENNVNPTRPFAPTAPFENPGLKSGTPNWKGNNNNSNGRDIGQFRNPSSPNLPPIGNNAPVPRTPPTFLNAPGRFDKQVPGNPRRTWDDVLSTQPDREFVRGLNVRQRSLLNRLTPEQIDALQRNGRWEGVKKRLLRGDETILNAPMEPPIVANQPPQTTTSTSTATTTTPPNTSSIPATPTASTPPSTTTATPPPGNQPPSTITTANQPPGNQPPSTTTTAGQPPTPPTDQTPATTATQSQLDTATASIPSMPTSTSPGSTSPGPMMSGTSVSFSWSAVSGAKYYEFGISDTVSGKLVVDTQTSSRCQRRQVL
ncbi:MAG: hypothetical protein HY243_06450 [Proteobacteria bacterium]|nr:hypothetical protein [Pseudomonadota bacterium]